MKTLLTLIYTLPMLALSLHAQKGTINQSERQFLLDYLQVTEKQMIEKIESLSEEDWMYKPDENTWSAAQCVSHILMAEQGLLAQVKQALNEPAQEMDLRENDAWLISKVADRGTKVKTPLPEEPKTLSQSEAIQSLKDSRAAIYTFLKDKKLPLRNHFGKSPYGPADAYQVLLVAGAHGMRHYAQIEEVLHNLDQ